TWYSAENQADSLRNLKIMLMTPSLWLLACLLAGAEISGGVVQEPERRHPPRPVPRVASERAAAPTGPDREPAASLGQLRQRLGDYLAQPKFASASWGVKVVSLDTGIMVFEHNPQKLFSPA